MTTPAPMSASPAPTRAGVHGVSGMFGPSVVPWKLKQQMPSTSSGNWSASACGLVIAAIGRAEPKTYEPTSSKRLLWVGLPTCAALIVMVIVHGVVGPGVDGHDTLPLSMLLPGDGD